MQVTDGHKSSQMYAGVRLWRALKVISKALKSILKNLLEANATRLKLGLCDLSVTQAGK